MSAYVSIRQHTSAYVSIRQLSEGAWGPERVLITYILYIKHTSAYVSIRQHTSAYVSSLGLGVQSVYLLYADVC
jgi:hypothetical protein